MPFCVVFVTSMFASAVYVVFVPLVMRTSSIDTWIWFVSVTLAPTWNTPPAVFATVAAPLAVMRLGDVGADAADRDAGAGVGAVALEVDGPDAGAEVGDLDRDRAGEAGEPRRSRC